VFLHVLYVAVNSIKTPIIQAQAGWSGSCSFGRYKRIFQLILQRCRQAIVQRVRRRLKLKKTIGLKNAKVAGAFGMTASDHNMLSFVL
jgi:hypothetical protein